MSSVLTELRDGVFHVRLNRSQVHNALDGDLVESLHTATTTREGTRPLIVRVREEGTGKWI